MRNLVTEEEGKFADLIVLFADPLEDTTNIRKLKMVLKGGKLIDITPQEGLVDFWELFFQLLARRVLAAWHFFARASSVKWPALLPDGAREK